MPTSRVTVVVPGGREHIWVSHDAAVVSWQIGQLVTFRNSQWRVVERRAEQPDSVTLMLGPASA